MKVLRELDRASFVGKFLVHFNQIVPYRSLLQSSERINHLIDCYTPPNCAIYQQFSFVDSDERTTAATLIREMHKDSKSNHNLPEKVGDISISHYSLLAYLCILQDGAPYHIELITAYDSNRNKIPIPTCNNCVHLHGNCNVYMTCYESDTSALMLKVWPAPRCAYVIPNNPLFRYSMCLVSDSLELCEYA